MIGTASPTDTTTEMLMRTSPQIRMSLSGEPPHYIYTYEVLPLRQTPGRGLLFLEATR